MKKYIALLVTSLFYFYLTYGQVKGNKQPVCLLTKDSVFTSGNLHTLAFKGLLKDTPKLYLTNSYGTTICPVTKVDKYLFFKIPKAVNSKRGLVQWQLIQNSKTLLQSRLHIVSDTLVSKIETYIGPPSIMAGNRDFSMIVMIPTDTLDNPVMDNSKVVLKKQFLNVEDTTHLSVKNLISYRRIYATKKTGRYLISSKAFNKSSTEHTLHVWPALPTDFTIKAQRNHKYADGNQLTQISTSIVKDTYGNVVSNGTFVNFIIEDKDGFMLSAKGTTINGIASTKLAHPDHEQVWKIKSFIQGIAESNEITLTYKQVVTDFQVVFSEHNRQITVGPLRSFMQQMIPDGLRVTLDIQKGNKTHKYMVETSKNGFVSFLIDPDNYKNESYDFTITAASVQKTFKNKRVW